MIQTYDDMSRQVRQFETAWNGDGQLQKIYSSSRYISVSLRSMGKTVYLYFGRGNKHEGFWVGEKQISSVLRKKDQMLEYMRKHISGARLLGIEVDPVDRIIWLNYQKFGQPCSFGFFYAGRKLYFASLFYDQKSSGLKLLRSWERGVSEVKPKEEIFLEVGKTPQNNTLTSPEIPTIERLLKKELEEASLKKGRTNKKGKSLKRKIANIQKDLEKAGKWKELKTWLEKQEDLSSLPMVIKVSDIKIRFKEKEHFKRRDEVYEKIKKLKRGEKIQKERLSEIKEPLEEPDKETLSSSTLEVIKPVWPNQAKEKKKNETQSEDGYKVHKLDGYEIGVGISARGNDQMRKLWAKKNDIWFHLDQAVSPHIIVKNDGSPITPEMFQKVAEIMKKNADSDAGELNLIYTQVKNLKGISGKPGAVIYKKEKRVRVYPGG